jgi:hypothetical protein
MKKILLSSLLISFVVVLAACAGSGPKGIGMTQEAAKDLGNIALDSQNRLLKLMPGGAGLSLALSSGTHLPKQLTRLLPRHGLSTLSTEEVDCIRVEGDVSDADSDEIPANATFTFACAYSEEGSDITISGSAHFQDANDNDASSGYSIVFEDFIVTESKAGETNRLELNQRFVLGVEDDKRLYVIENDLELSASTPAGSFTYSELATLSYAPDELADPFAAGTFALNGVTTWQSGEDVYKLTEVSPGLHYSATCESGFDAGELYIEDNFENRLELIFNACSDVTVIYNGSPLASEE